MMASRFLSNVSAGLLFAVVASGALPAVAQTAKTAPAVATKAKARPAAKSSDAQARIRKADAAIRRAYQKEFAYLMAEKKALVARLAAAEKKAKADTARRAQELAALEAAVMATTRQADAAEDALTKAQRETEVAADTASSLDSIRDQAAKAAGMPEGSSLEEAFAKTIATLRDNALMHVENGRFFTREGVEVKGEIANVGGVARFGVSGQAAGALAPAGGNQWKIWPTSDPASARAVVSGRAPASVGVFLAAKTDAAISPPKEKTPLSIVRAGGTVAWVIVALGALGLVLAFLRLALLRVLARGRSDLEDDVFAAIAEGRFEAAKDLVRNAPGALARVLFAALEAANRPTSERADLIDERLLREQARADFFASALIVVAAVAPLLGLLGTVTGMISTFDAITEVGTGDPRTLAGGISEALITTELGLIVAIPTLLLGNLLGGVGERLKRRLEISALAIQNRFEDRAMVEANESDVVTPFTVARPSSEPRTPGARLEAGV